MKVLLSFFAFMLLLNINASAHQSVLDFPSVTVIESFDCTDACSTAYISGRFTYEENGRTVAYIELRSNGKVTMYDESTSTYYGTYEIIGDINYDGGTNRIVFYIDGSTYSGTIFFPLADKWGISFDGLYFQLN